MNHIKRCSRCIFDETVPDITFDNNGVCNYCHAHDKLVAGYAMNHSSANKEAFYRLIENVKRDGKGREIDCIAPLSGGSDSSYVLYAVKKLGLRPLAYNIDNGWCSPSASKNIENIVDALDVPFKKVVPPPWKDLKKLFLACINASIPEVCLICQVDCYSALYRVAAQEGVRYVFYGLSPKTEGIGPLKWSYADGRYLDSVIRAYAGRQGVRIASGMNKLHIVDLLRSILVKKIKIIQLPLYMDWDKVEIKRTLAENCGWVDGGGKHFDCLFKPFRNYVLAKKFSIDLRKIEYAAYARSGKMSREEALNYINETSPIEEREKIEFAMERLGITHEQLETIFEQEKKNYADYPTYYGFIKLVKPFIKMLSKMHFLPEASYEKFFE